MQRIFGLLFAGAFAAAGLFCLAMAANETWNSVRAVSWPTVPADIQSLKLKRSGRGEDESWKVDCRYRYRFGNQVYESDTVTLSKISQSSRSASQPLFERLTTDRDRNRAVVHVNPLAPTESALDVTIHPGMIAFMLLFCLTHGTIGLGLMSWLWFAKPPRRTDDGWQLVSQNWVGRRCRWVVMALHLLVLLLAAPVALLCLIHGQLSALFLLVIAGISLAILLFCSRWIYAAKHRGQSLRIIFPSAQGNDAPVGELRLNRGVVETADVETRWSVNIARSGQTGAEAVTGDAIGTDQVAPQGTIQFELPTLSELPQPELTDAEKRADRQYDGRVKLEAMGLVDGLPYEDSFKFTAAVLEPLMER